MHLFKIFFAACTNYFSACSAFIGKHQRSPGCIDCNQAQPQQHCLVAIGDLPLAHHQDRLCRCDVQQRGSILASPSCSIPLPGLKDPHIHFSIPFSTSHAAAAPMRNHQHCLQTEHINMPHHWTCWVIGTGSIRLMHCSMDDTVADALLKPPPFRHFTASLITAILTPIPYCR